VHAAAYDHGVSAESSAPKDAAAVPQVRLGSLMPGGLAPAILAMVERGAHHRPTVARSLRGEVELSTGGEHPPVRIVFEEGAVLIEDGPSQAPDLRISGELPDLVSLMVAPLLGGVPSPVNARGRAALGMVARRRVRFEGGIALTRRFLQLIRI
jgi:hypothetical protein